MTSQLHRTSDGLRARLSEAEWAAAIAGRDTSEAGALAPLQALGPSQDASPDEALMAAAALALGDGFVHLEIATGAGERGVLAQVGCDAVAAGVAVRALVPAADGSGPVAVPGVEVGLNETVNVVAEIMRLFPAGGLTRQADHGPVTMPHELALTLHQALRSGDDAVARLTAEQAGFTAPPEVMVSLARATTASATLTARISGSATSVVQQRLLCDVGWVLLTVRGTRVTHTVQSRDEVRDSLVHLMAGALDAVGRHG